MKQKTQLTTNVKLLEQLVEQLIEYTNQRNKLTKEGKELPMELRWNLNNVWTGLRMITNARKNKLKKVA